jgi:hypothetical protein
MADAKISALTGATTPLAGTEVLPIVQSGSTVKVSVANLTAGRAVAMAGGSFTDNLTQGTAAKGVNFTANTPAAGMTSQLLNWYEEGTWTPSLGGDTTYSAQLGKFTRIGRQVTLQCDLRVTLIGTGSVNTVAGAPYSSGSTFYAGSVSYWSNLPSNFTYVSPMIFGSSIQFGTTLTAGGTAITYPSTIFRNDARVVFSVTYFI